MILYVFSLYIPQYMVQAIDISCEGGFLMKKNVEKRTSTTNTPDGTDQTEMVRHNFFGNPEDGVVTDPKPMPIEAIFKESKYRKEKS